MTKEEFIEGYAQRLGVTAEYMKTYGLEAIPCYCGKDGCKGWQMTMCESVGEAWQREHDYEGRDEHSLTLAGERVYTISWLPEVNTQNGFPRRPDHPEDFQVELFTADGKRWVAEWKEAPP